MPPPSAARRAAASRGGLAATPSLQLPRHRPRPLPQKPPRLRPQLAAAPAVVEAAAGARKELMWMRSRAGRPAALQGASASCETMAVPPPQHPHPQQQQPQPHPHLHPWLQRIRRGEQALWQLPPPESATAARRLRRRRSPGALRKGGKRPSLQGTPKRRAPKEAEATEAGGRGKAGRCSSGHGRRPTAPRGPPRCGGGRKVLRDVAATWIDAAALWRSSAAALEAFAHLTCVRAPAKLSDQRPPCAL